MSNAYMTDDIIIIRYGGHDTWGDELETETAPIKGRIEYKTRLVMNLSGEQVISSASILLPESTDDELFRDLIHEDFLKFDGVEHTIIRINTPKAFSSFFVYKYEVFVQ